MKLLLTSSGLKNDAIAHALEDLAGTPLSQLSIIHIPTAANTELGDKRWVIDDLKNLERYNFKLIDILDVSAVTESVWKSRLQNADIISFGGGDEQYLAKIFVEIGMKEFLLSMQDTKIYMGTSAGSMVMGQFLPQSLLSLVYPEESFETTRAESMHFYDFLFIPHLNSNWFAHVRKESLDKLKDQFKHPVYAMDDYTALTVVDNEVKIIGTGNYWISKTTD